MSRFCLHFKILMPLVLAVFAAIQSYGQCSLSIIANSDNVALPIQIVASGTVSNQYTWSFGDGSADTITGNSSVLHQYADTGIYNVCVYGLDSNTQCRDTACSSISLRCRVSGTILYSPDSTGLATFTAVINATGGVTLYRWQIANLNRTVVYNNSFVNDTLRANLLPGKYFVEVVVVTGSGCQDSVFSDTIVISSPCGTRAAFSYTFFGADSVSFLNSSFSNNGTICQWTFYNANGITGGSNQANPKVVFSGQLPYSASLKITDSLHAYCIDSIGQQFGSSCRTLQQGVPQGLDTYIRSDIPNINFGLSPDFLAQQWYYNNGRYSEARGLIKFDLSSIPLNSGITSAYLMLYADSTTANSGNGYPGEPTYGNDSSVLQRITSPWNQLSVTWNTQPATTNADLVGVPQSTNVAQNYTLDITSFLKFWIQYPDSNFGMMLSMPAGPGYSNLIFCSSAHPDSALRPALDICYVSAPNGCNAAFTYSNMGDSVRFYNQSTGSASVFWRFDDGDSSVLNNPVHSFNHNGIHLTTLTIGDSATGCSITNAVNVNSIVNDTLCGVVFFDSNNDHLYDYGDQALSNFQVVIDGNSFYTDNSGFYRIPVGGGGHIITATVPFYYTQTSPSAPLSYTIATTNYDYICGLDFGLSNGSSTGIKPVTDNGLAGLFVFPNPVTGSKFDINMSATLQVSDAVITLADVLGRDVKLSSIEKHEGGYTVYLTNSIQPGLYNLQYKSGTQQLSVKLIVVK